MLAVIGLALFSGLTPIKAEAAPPDFDTVCQTSPDLPQDLDARDEVREAFDFAKRIQAAVRAKDADAYFELVNVETAISGPSLSYLERAGFDAVFPADWQKQVIADTPPCGPVGWRGYMLAHGLVWFDKFGEDWGVFAINGHNLEPYPAKSHVWEIGDQAASALCFVTDDALGDPLDILSGVPPQPLSKCGTKNLQVAEPLLPLIIPPCPADTQSCAKADYDVVAELGPEACDIFETDEAGQCTDVRIVEVYIETGGTMRGSTHYVAFGLFEKDGDLWFVNLHRFGNELDMRDFLDQTAQ